MERFPKKIYIYQDDEDGDYYYSEDEILTEGRDGEAVGVYEYKGYKTVISRKELK